MTANLENSAVGTGLENVSFNSNPKEGQCQRIFRLPHNCTHPYASKVIFKILQARLQQQVNWKLPDIKVGCRKGGGTRDQIANISWVREKAREFQKKIYFCFIHCSKTFDYVDYDNLWKILKVMGLPDHLTCLLRNLYASQEATVRTGHGTTAWFKTGKQVWQCCMLSRCLFNCYAEYITTNGLDESQPGIKIARRNINNLWHADDNYSKGRKGRETKESLDEGERGEWKSCLKTQHSKN